jgi:hypothetical protein
VPVSVSAEAFSCPAATSLLLSPMATALEDMGAFAARAAFCFAALLGTPPSRPSLSSPTATPALLLPADVKETHQQNSRDQSKTENKTTTTIALSIYGNVRTGSRFLIAGKMLSFKVLTFARRRLLLDLLRRHAVAAGGLVLQQQLLQAQLAVVVGLPAAWRDAVLLAAGELLGSYVRGGFQVLLLCGFGNAQEGSVTAQQGKVRFTANSGWPLYAGQRLGDPMYQTIVNRNPFALQKQGPPGLTKHEQHVV